MLEKIKKFLKWIFGGGLFVYFWAKCFEFLEEMFWNFIYDKFKSFFDMEQNPMATFYLTWVIIFTISGVCIFVLFKIAVFLYDDIKKRIHDSKKLKIDPSETVISIYAKHGMEGIKEASIQSHFLEYTSYLDKKINQINILLDKKNLTHEYITDWGDHLAKGIRVCLGEEEQKMFRQVTSLDAVKMYPSMASTSLPKFLKDCKDYINNLKKRTYPDSLSETFRPIDLKGC